jgi:hypothetical protein
MPAICFACRAFRVVALLLALPGLGLLIFADWLVRKAGPGYAWDLM